jgi:hypothetical protein
LTTSRGPSPPIKVFQQGDDILAIMELPGVDKNELQIEAKANTIRISGKKIGYSDGASVHRRERISGEFDRTLSRCRSKSIQMASRPNIVMAFSPCSCPGPRATSRWQWPVNCRATAAVRPRWTSHLSRR